MVKIIDGNDKKFRKLSVVAVVSFSAALMLCSILIGVAIINRDNFEKLKAQQLVFEKSVRIDEAISRLHYRIQELSVLVMQRNGNMDVLDMMAPAIIANDPSIVSIIIAPDGIVTSVYPLEGNEAILGLNLLDEETGSEAVAARKSGAFVLDGPLDLPQGGQTLIGILPVYIEDSENTGIFWGFISVGLKLPQVLDDAELEIINRQGFSYELFRIKADTGEKQIIASFIEHTDSDNRFIEQHMQIYNVHWYLRVFPIRRWYSHPENLVLIIMGLFLSFLIFFIMQNNSELKRMRGVFETMANIDVLTGIYNRRYIEENLKRVINSISRSGGKISLLMIDVDFFKKYNDTYGHGKGDSCLKTVASALAQSLFREEDFVARYGGEEFLVVLPFCDAVGVHKIADRLLQSIRDCNIPHEKNDAASCVTVSIGVTTGNAEYTRNANDYIKSADEALYMSKQSGRNKYTFTPFP